MEKKFRKRKFISNTGATSLMTYTQLKVINIKCEFKMNISHLQRRVFLYLSLTIGMNIHRENKWIELNENKKRTRTVTLMYYSFG